jgi:hypothetical protein
LAKGVRKSLHASKPPKKRQAYQTVLITKEFGKPAYAAEKAAFFVILLANAALLLTAAVSVFFTVG